MSTDIRDPLQPHSAGREFVAKDRKSELQQSVRDAGTRLGVSDNHGGHDDGLRQKLREQEQLTLDAIRSSSELQRQLTATQAEVATMQAKWLNLQKESLGRKASAQDLADLAQSRSKLLLLEKDFAREQQGRQTDNAHSAETITQLQRDLQVATIAATVAETARRRQRQMWFGITTGSAAAAVFLGAGLIYRCWPLFSSKTDPPPVAEQVAARSLETASLTTPSGHYRRSPTTPYKPSGPQPELTMALGRLTHALAGFRSASSQDVLRAVSVKASTPQHPVCAFEWNNGEPSIAPNAQAGQTLHGVTETLTRCAEAVERFQ
jgi:hypothetical protein